MHLSLMIKLNSEFISNDQSSNELVRVSVTWPQVLKSIEIIVVW